MDVPIYEFTIILLKYYHIAFRFQLDNDYRGTCIVIIYIIARGTRSAVRSCSGRGVRWRGQINTPSGDVGWRFAVNTFILFIHTRVHYK